MESNFVDIKQLIPEISEHNMNADVNLYHLIEKDLLKKIKDIATKSVTYRNRERQHPERQNRENRTEGSEFALISEDS